MYTYLDQVNLFPTLSSHEMSPATGPLGDVIKATSFLHPPQWSTTQKPTPLLCHHLAAVAHSLPPLTFRNC